jgi:hypothetical protein
MRKSHIFALVALLIIVVLERVNAQPPDSTWPVNPLGWKADSNGRFIMALTLDQQGNVWVGTEDDGIWRHALPDQKWTHFTTKDGLGDDNGYALACDQRGRIWAGHRSHGVSVFNGREWKNYGVLEGPLGERVFAIATCPTDGDVWIATNGALTRYSLKKDEWSYFPRTDAAALDQVSALAFDKAGNLYAGTQCDGVALALAADNYATWRTVHAPPEMPATPTGTGLPSDLINDVLVARDSTIYAATTGGLTRSTDRGQNWSFIRGADWKQNVEGLYNNPQLPPPQPPNNPRIEGDLLSEDWATCLAEDKSGLLWIGYRQQGFEARDAKSNQRAFRSGDDAQNAIDNDWVHALLMTPEQTLLIGRYGGDMGGLGQFRKFLWAAPPDAALPDKQELPARPAAVELPPLPAVARAPDAEALETMRKQVTALQSPAVPGSGAYLGEDWRTGGDWVGRYGREHTVLCAAANPFSHELGWDSSYKVSRSTGPHHVGAGGVYGWIHWLKTDNPGVLYDPIIGSRRQAEWNDGSFDAGNYPFTWEGPDLWLTVQVPAGAHRVSLYFFNKDGHDGGNRYRDYVVELKSFMENLDVAEVTPALARTRVRDFWGGVYKQFLVQGPSKYSIKIARNHSHVTMLQAVMIDKMPLRRDFRYDALPWMGDVAYDPPGAAASNDTDKNDPNPLRSSRALWQALDTTYTWGNGAGLQYPYRIMAYRAALAAGGPPALLANWRWKLALWSTEERAKFGQVMAQAWQAQAKMNQELSEPKP